jgi:anthranilate synthase component 2
MKIVLIDNYDSFTHILAQYLKEQAGVYLTILKNDAFTPEALEPYDRILISPGPGLPDDAGNIKEVIRRYSGKKVILGVCLGLQAIYESFGGTLLNLTRVQHGVTSKVDIIDATDPVFKGIDSPFNAGRYHSWVCDPKTLPASLVITARDQEGMIMACRHRSHHTYGVQFHPESILTPEGKKMIQNFVAIKYI